MLLRVPKREVFTVRILQLNVTIFFYCLLACLFVVVVCLLFLLKNRSLHLDRSFRTIRTLSPTPLQILSKRVCNVLITIPCCHNYILKRVQNVFFHIIYCFPVIHETSFHMNNWSLLVYISPWYVALSRPKKRHETNV